MTRKPRSDSKLLNLPADQQQVAFRYIKALGYEPARLKIKSELNLDISVGAMHAAYQHWAREESENRILQAVTGADAILDAAAGNLPKLDQAMEAALKQAAFEAALSGDNETIKTLVELTLKVGKAGQDERALKLQIDRFQFDAAKAALKHVATLKAIQTDKSMSMDDKITNARRHLFGVIAEDPNG